HHRVVPERGDPPPSARRVDLAPELALRDLPCARALVRQPAAALVPLARRPLPRMRRAHLAALSDHRALDGRAVRGGPPALLPDAHDPPGLRVRGGPRPDPPPPLRSP